MASRQQTFDHKRFSVDNRAFSQHAALILARLVPPTEEQITEHGLRWDYAFPEGPHSVRICARAIWALRHTGAVIWTGWRDSAWRMTVDWSVVEERRRNVTRKFFKPPNDLPGEFAPAVEE